MLACLIGFQVFLRLRRRFGDRIATPVRWAVVAAAVAGAAVGSKVLFWLEDPRLTWHNLNDPSYLMGGKTIVGALVFGLITVELNTNGVRIAQDEDFAKQLADCAEDFEVYLQFDSFERETLMQMRGADLRRVREDALERLNRYNISTSLVVTLKKGLNDHEIGRITDFALEQRCVRGVTFQPIQDAGRLEGFNPATDRLTLTEVRRKILEQTRVFRAEDVIPVPCHPDSLAMAYALKVGGKVTPLTSHVPPDVLINAAGNTILYEQEAAVRDSLFKLFATNSPRSGAGSLRELLCCLPKVFVPEHISYENVFRVIIMQFIDAHSFDVRSVKKTCVHIVHPDGRLIPFDTYNLFYRDGLEQTRLAPLRQRVVPAPSAQSDSISAQP
jgi:tetraether lipid synthase